MTAPPKPSKSYDYICPLCNCELEATRDLSDEVVTCPSCAKQFRGADADPVERVLAKYEPYLKQYDAYKSSSGDSRGPTERKSTRAVLSLIFGLAGVPLFWFPLVPLVAVLLGQSALRAIARSEGMLNGRLRAWIGLVLGFLEFFLLFWIISTSS